VNNEQKGYISSNHSTVKLHYKRRT